MMQTWADYLDGLKAGATVIPLKIVQRKPRFLGTGQSEEDIDTIVGPTICVMAFLTIQNS
jgi:hypothetical protein